MKIVRVSNSTFVRGTDGSETYSREYYVEGKTVQDIADIAAEYGQTDDTLYLYDDAGELIAAAMWPQTGGGYRYCYGAGLDPNPAWRIWRTKAPAKNGENEED